MRKIDGMIAVLKRGAQEPDGRILAPKTSDGMEEYHQVELLKDCGLVEWDSEDVVRVTNEGTTFWKVSGVRRAFGISFSVTWNSGFRSLAPSRRRWLGCPIADDFRLRLPVEQAGGQNPGSIEAEKRWGAPAHCWERRTIVY